MDPKFVQDYFSLPGAVAQYGHAAEVIGLWESEKIAFGRAFGIHDEILEVGCGAGRIAFGLCELGYTELTAVDYSLRMVMEAYRQQQVRGYNGVKISHGDATALEFKDNSFNGVIFGFNGLMQIPGRARRQKAVEEIYRVMKPGGTFIFTTHDRSMPHRAEFWKEEVKKWKKGKQDKDLEDFGDVLYEAEHGMLYIHIPTKEEIEGMLRIVGFEVEGCMLRSDLASESPQVLMFSDECLFWVAHKPRVS